MKRCFLLAAIMLLFLFGCTAAPEGIESVLSTGSEAAAQSTVHTTPETVPAESPAAETQKRKLSEFSDEELLAFVRDCNIEIPYDYRDEERCAAFIREIVTTIEEAPDYRFGYSYPVTLDFAETIRSAVILYYDE